MASEPLTTTGKKLDDGAIVAMLQTGVRASVGFSESRLSKERQRVMQYCYGELPKPLHAGNSKYVSLDVYDTVESMKAQLLEVFSGNSQPVTFAPQGAHDVQEARTATAYTNYVFFRQNHGFKIMQSVIQDGLMFRAGVAKVWWDEREDERVQTVSNVAVHDLAAFSMQNPQVQIESIELTEDRLHVARATVKEKVDKSQVRIEALPPEEFGISPRAKSIEEADLVFHRQFKTVSQLLKEGYDKAKVTKLYDNENLWLTTEPEVLTRFENTDDTVFLDHNIFDERQRAEKSIMVYECYLNLDLNGDDKSQLYKVTYADNVILDKEPVSRKPFVAFVPIPKPHSFWGHNFAELSIPTQNAKTALSRAIVDHTLITTNPRYTVLRGGLTNPRELLENRIGGIVNTTRPDAVAPLQQAGLNPFVFTTIQALSEDKEQRTGISQLSQGLSKDAISKQNSADMVEQLISVSQIRQKIVARNFAEGFLRELFLMLYKLVVENESRERIVQIAGSWTPVNPSAWPERDDLIVDFTLGYGEKEKEAQKFVHIDQYLAQPGLARMYPEQQRYHTLRRALECMGVRDVDTYLVDPTTLPPPQPDPMQQADLQMKQADAQVKQANAQAAVAKLQLEREKVAGTQQLHAAKLQGDASKTMTQMQLETAKFEHQVAVDTAELALQHEAAQQQHLQAVAEPK